MNEIFDKTRAHRHDHEPSAAAPVIDAAFLRASWRRSELAGVDHAAREVPFLGQIDDSRLLHCAREPIERMREAVEHLPISLALSDGRARILTRMDNSQTVARALDAVSFAPGFDYGEGVIGTNGIGTVLASGKPAHIAGEHHFQQQFTRLTCSGAPIRDPLSGRIEGVIDLSGISDDSCVVMHSLVRTGAREIERALLLDRSAAQRAMFERFVVTDARVRHAVFAISPSVEMANAEAQRAFSADEQHRIRQHGMLLLERGRDAREVLELSDGMLVRLKSRVVKVADTPAGIICEARRLDAVVGSVAGSRRGVSATEPRLRTPEAVALSTTPAMLRACGEIERLLVTRRRVLLVGESGTGRVSLLDRLWRCTQAGAYNMVLLTPEIFDDGAALARRLSGFRDGTLIVLRDAQELTASGALRLRRMFGATASAMSGALLAATMTVSGEGTPAGLEHVLDAFDETVSIPALRHRRDDIPQMAQRILDRRAAGGRHSFSPATVRALTAHAWPGNLRELEAAVAHALRCRPVGAIQPSDLPGSCFARSSGTLSDLARAERDTIISALRDHGGNRSRAAAVLGISRSSLYRKLASFGINEC